MEEPIEPRGEPSAVADVVKETATNVPPSGSLSARKQVAMTVTVDPLSAAELEAKKTIELMHHRDHKHKLKKKTVDYSRYNESSLWIFKNTNPIRQWFIRLIENKWFDRFILAVIFVNSGFLAAFDPWDTKELNPDSVRRQVLDSAGFVFTIIFLVEFVCKVISLGFWFGKGAYLSSGWNWLDFFIVMVSLLDFIPGGSTGNLSSLRTLRVMRPLRAITRFQELRFLVTLLLQCIPMLMNVLMLCAFIFFVFGILGVQLFAGTLKRRCFKHSDGTLLDEEFVCSLGGYGWHTCPPETSCLSQFSNPNYDATHFDHIGSALLTIFQIMTYEGWTTTMYYLQDAYSFWAMLYVVPPDIHTMHEFVSNITSPAFHRIFAPSLTRFFAFDSYFIAVLFVGPIFAIQLFLVVISNKFAQTSKTQRQINELGLAVPVQPINTTAKIRRTLRRWLLKLGISKERITSLTSPAMHPTGQNFSRWQLMRVKLGQFAEGPLLSNFIVAIIVVNTLFMAMEHDCEIDATTGSDAYCKNFKLSMEIANLVFTFVFAVEMLVKMVGMGLVRYFNDGYNVFDFLIVVTSIVELPDVISLADCLASQNGPGALLCTGGGSGLSVLRTFRLVRIVKLLRAFPAMQRQMKVVAASLSAVAGLCVLIVLFILIFAILGMNVFGAQVWTVPDANEINLGSQVMVKVPGSEQLLPGKVVNILQWFESQAPYQVSLRFETYGLQEVWCDFDSLDGLSRGPEIVGIIPRSHFNTLVSALVTVFQILTQEDWNLVMYEATIGSGGLWVSLYFVVLIVIGNYMLLNLFIAIIIQGFAEQGAEQAIPEVSFKLPLKERLRNMARDRRNNVARRVPAWAAKVFCCVDVSKIAPESVGEIDGAVSVITEGEGPSMPPSVGGVGPMNGELTAERTGGRKSPVMISTVDVNSTTSLKTPNSNDSRRDSALMRSPTAGTPMTPGMVQRKSSAIGILTSMQSSSVVEELKGRAWFCLGPKNRFRKFLYGVVVWPGFDHFILFAILLSSVALAMERPGIVSPEKDFLEVLNLALNAIFFMEMILKITAFSFPVYIQSNWNRLDFFIVATAIIDTVMTYSSGGSGAVSSLRILRIFRIFRALRPLRVISKARGLRIVVTTITGSVGPVMNTVAIALMVFFIFGILGVQLFSGSLHYCSDITIHKRSECVGTDIDGAPRRWLNRDINFDHIGSAILTMFMLASQDNWPDIMRSGVDATSKFTGPIVDYNLPAILFFLSFILVGTFFVLNIFVGVFVDNFNQASSQVKQHMALEAARAAASAEVSAMKSGDNLGMATGSSNGFSSNDKDKNSIISSQPADDYPTAIRRACLTFVSATEFDLAIALCISLNVICMAFESYKQASWQRTFLTGSNYFFTYIFSLECIVKLLAFHSKGYFSDSWNKFDFFIVMVSFVGIVFDESPGASMGLNPTILRVLRVFRIFRILRAFRIFKAAKGLQAIVEALGKSLPAIGNLAALLLLLFFIYGILAVEVYGNLCTTSDQPSPYYDRCLLLDPEVLLDSHASFINIGMALLTLWRISTSDNWGAIMISCNLAPGARIENALEYAKSAYDLGELSTVRALLPGCVTIDELQYLGVECGNGSECLTTCGTSFSPAFFCSFLCLSNFVLLNLVIAVLMEQLAESEGDSNEMVTATLSKRTFARLYWRWKVNSHRVRRSRLAGRPVSGLLETPTAMSLQIGRLSPGSAPGSANDSDSELAPAYTVGEKVSGFGGPRSASDGGSVDVSAQFVSKETVSRTGVGAFMPLPVIDSSSSIEINSLDKSKFEDSLNITDAVDQAVTTSGAFGSSGAKTSPQATTRTEVQVIGADDSAEEEATAAMPTTPT